MQKYAFLGGIFDTLQQYSKKEVFQHFPIVVKYMKIFDRMERDRVISKGKFKRVKKVELDYLNSPFFDIIFHYLFELNNLTRYSSLEKMTENEQYKKWFKNKKVTVKYIDYGLTSEDLIYYTKITGPTGSDMIIYYDLVSPFYGSYTPYLTYSFSEQP